MQVFNFAKTVKQKLKEQQKLLVKKNKPLKENNGQYLRWENPVLTAQHVPLSWCYDFDSKTNPFFMERLGVNAVFNSGAIYVNGKFVLLARVEGVDRKSFFAIAESTEGTHGFNFTDIIEIQPSENEVNVYDMRLTAHEDGYIYGTFCSERKDADSKDLSAALASAGIVRTKDLKTFERLPNLVTKSPQQRNVVLHPEFVNGKYMFYTRPQDSFIEAGSGGGICYGFCDDILKPVIEKETLLNARHYHTITESKNGAGAVPIKTDKGWIHIAHGVRNTAAGLRYVIYVFATDLNDPTKVIAMPGGYFIAPQNSERVGDVSNVVFTNGAVVKDNQVYIYYGGSDTRLYVATTTLDRLIDYTFNTPKDDFSSSQSVKTRKALIDKNLEILK